MPTDDRRHLARAAAIGGLWTSLQAVLSKVFAVAATLIVASFLGPEQFGDANRAVAIVASLALFTPYAMGDVLVAHQRRLPRLAHAGDRIGLAAGAAMTAVAVVASPFLALWLPDGASGAFVALMLVASARPLLEAIAVSPLAVLRSDLRYRTIALIDGSTQLAASILTIAMAVFGAGPFGLVVPQLVALAARGIAYRARVPVLRRPTNIRLGIRLLIVPFLLGSLAQYVHNVLVILELLALTWLSDTTQVGLYAFCFSLASQANVMIAFQLGSVLQPIFGKIGTDQARLAQALLRTVRVLGSVIVPVSVIQAALAPTLFEALFPSRWLAGMPTFVALCALQAVYFGNAPLMSFLKARRRFRAFLAWQLVQFLFSAAVFAWAAHSHGAFGVAIASTVVWAVAVPSMTAFAVRGSGIPLPAVASAFIRPWVPAIPLGAAALAVGDIAGSLPVMARLALLGLTALGALVAAVTATRWTDQAAWQDLRVPFDRLRARLSRT